MKINQFSIPVLVSKLKDFIGYIPKSEKSLINTANKFWQREKGNDLNIEKSLSHHLGARNWENDRFLEYGKMHLMMLKKLLNFINDTNIEFPKLNTVVEWGPGGGANILSFAEKVCSKYYGADISRENLDECISLCKKYNINNFYDLLIDIHNPEDVINKVSSCDFFLCTAVFPHLPTKTYAIRIIKIAYELLNSGGTAIFHVQLTEKRKYFNFNYTKNVHANTVFTYEEILHVLKNVGFQIIYITRDSIANYSYFHVQKK